MCLVVEDGYGPGIAKEDILCYKAVKPVKGNRHGHAYSSLYRGTVQYYNKVVNAKGLRWNHEKKCSELIKIPFLTPIYERRAGKIVGRINDGFHAYMVESKAAKEACWWDVDGVVIRKAIIPKGAEYCYGDNNDIVATKMIVFGSDKAYQKYLASKESK